MPSPDTNATASSDSATASPQTIPTPNSATTSSPTSGPAGGSSCPTTPMRSNRWSTRSGRGYCGGKDRTQNAERRAEKGFVVLPSAICHLPSAICFPKVGKPSLRVTPLRENLAMPTEPEPIRCCVDVFDAPPPTRVAERMALMKDETWGSGFKLRVRFLEGEKAVQDKVKKVALQWMDHANINMVFVKDGDAEVRVAFRPGGSWSEVGKRSKKIEQAKPSMNFGWLTPVTADDEYQRVVLHEFGHALGCIHEHQHPAGGIHWNKQKVYDYYKRTNGWDPPRVD